MPRLIDRFRSPSNPANTPTRGDYVRLYETWASGIESPETSFDSYVTEGYKRNGVVFAVILARMMLLSEIRFMNRDDATLEPVTGTNLPLLRRPWTNGTTGELVARMEQDASLGGNAYVYAARPDDPRQPVQLQRLRPDWVSIVTNGETVTGYVYQPPGSKQRFIAPGEMTHWSPIPDPTAAFRGMSWLQPVAEEILGDTEMTRHKRLFLRNAATPNLLIKAEGKLDPAIKSAIKDELAMRHEGVENAYRTLLLEGGADATVIGANLRQLDFAMTQAAGENRIAVAGGVPSIVVGLKEGLQAATYSNYGQAMRRFGDMTGRSLWRSMSSALETVAPPPTGSHLWYDTSDIAALRQDEKDAAEIKKADAGTINILINSGFDPDTVVPAVTSGDLSKLVHTGLTTVQLQPTSDEGATDATE